MSNTDWKSRLYESYVSSGQAVIGPSDMQALLRMRAPYFDWLISTQFPARKDVAIVDLGCGYGPLLLALKSAGYTNLKGVETSKEQVDLCKTLGLDCVEQGELMSFLTAQRDGSLDVVCALDVFEHLTRQELFDALDQIVRVLSPTGMLVLHVPNAEGIFGSRVRYSDLTHELAFTQLSANQMMTAVGFRSVQCIGDKPLVRGVKSAVRAILWKLVVLKLKIIHAAETGYAGIIPEQNMTVIAKK